MRVLLSAYACEPNKGSEQEVGWQRALHMLPLADEVWVLTRSNNRIAIEADPRSRSSGLHFIYYDLPEWVLRLKKQAWFLPFYFILWQYGAYRSAAREHRRLAFDAVYHVTFVSIKFGSFMGRLGIPFLVGPIAGGERAPLRLCRSMPLRCQMKEMLRDLGIQLQRYSPIARMALFAADHIYVTSEDSLLLVPASLHFKTSVHLAIAMQDTIAPSKGGGAPESARFIFVGRLLHWKGVHFAIQALAEVRKQVPTATLTLIGSGPDERWLRGLAKSFGVADAVEFAGYIPRQELLSSLDNYTAFVFPSLHDSGGSAVLEALQAGLPVLCLDIGGPGVMVNPSCGIVVSTENADEAAVVTGIARAMISLASMPPSDMEKLSEGAISRARQLSWTTLTKHVAAF